MHFTSKSCSKSISATLRITTLFLLICFIVAISGLAQDPAVPLSKSDVLQLLHNGISSKRVAALAREHKIDFQVDSATEADLRHAGATSDLISSLKDLAPPPIRTALVIQSTPGGATVYVDDAPAGTTSPEGYLKLSAIPPGQHRGRVSVDGYQDYAFTANVSQGEETDVDATLKSTRAVVPNNNTNPYLNKDDNSNIPYNNQNNQSQVTLPGGQAMVYFFRPLGYHGNLISPQIYCDGETVGKLPNGRYFSVNLPAGRHVFASTSKKTQVEVDLASGGTYYIMVSMVVGIPAKGAVSQVPSENGAASIGTLTPCGTSTDAAGRQISGCGQ